MKKTILLLAISLISVCGFSQAVIASFSATVTGTYTISVGTGNSGYSNAPGTGLNNWGTIEIFASSGFVGSTASDTLQASLNGTTWWTVRDNSGNLSNHTLSHKSTTASPYLYTINLALAKYYRIKYVAGDASAGTITETIYLK
jgi:hypothetical protein